MIKTTIENDTIEFEINGDIPTIICEMLSLVSAVHRMFLKAGKNAADEFRLGFCSMIFDDNVITDIFSLTEEQLYDQRIFVEMLKKNHE